MSARWLRLALLPLALAACGEEEPIGLGQELLPEDAIRTFEVVLEPGDFLVVDSSFSGYSTTRTAPFVLLAREYEGVLTANVLGRWNLPRAIVVRDTGTTLVPDSAAMVVSGELVMIVDTLGTDVGAAVQIGAYPLAEPWEPASATWTYRDTTGTALPWLVPGGTPGPEISRITYTAGDSIILPLDSTTLRAWQDTTDETRGVLVRMVEGTGRVRTLPPLLRVSMRSSIADTTVTLFANLVSRNFVYTPEPDTIASGIRSGGVPAWRAFLRFRDDLRERMIPCGTGCSVPLHALDITLAELLLQPEAPPPGFRPEVPLAPIAYLALVTPEVPLRRTLLGSQVGIVTELLEPERFVDGGEPVTIPLTEFLRLATADSAGVTNFFRPEWIAITSGAQTTFGFGTFASGPRLRLVLSTAQENQLP